MVNGVVSHNRLPSFSFSKASFVSNLLVRIAKLSVASAAFVLGVWALASDRYGPLVAEAVTNAPLVKLTAPADGYVLSLVNEGEFLVPGQVLLVVAPQATDGVRLEDFRNQTLDVTNPSFAETPLAAEVMGRLWYWRSPKGALHRSGESVGEVADCGRLVAVSQATPSRAANVHIGDPVTFSAGHTQLNGTVQRVIAGAPNLTGRYAVQFPNAAADNYLIFVALEVPTSAVQACEIGVRGRIHFQHETAGFWRQFLATPFEVAGRLLVRLGIVSAHVGMLWT